MDNEVRIYRCRVCGELLPREDFVTDRRSPKGFSSICKKCHVIKVTESKARKNKEMKLSLKLSNTMEQTNLQKIENRNNKPLCEYQSRELLAELKRRGYVWDPKSMYVKTYVDYNKI